MTNQLTIPGGCGMRETVAEPGMRVAGWHQTFAEQWDPVPGTIKSVGTKYLTVDFDDHGPRRVEPRNVTRWSEPREETS